MLNYILDSDKLKVWVTKFNLLTDNVNELDTSVQTLNTNYSALNQNVTNLASDLNTLSTSIPITYVKKGGDTLTGVLIGVTPEANATKELVTAEWVNTNSPKTPISSDINSESETTAASSKAVKILNDSISNIQIIKSSLEEVKQSEDGFYIISNDNPEEVKFNGCLPLGHIFTWPFRTPPDGCIIANGSEYNRELYKDLWTYVSSHIDWIKTEEEWQQIASSNNGYCSYYSTGDGTITFRTPKFSPFQQLALSLDTVGTYHEAGLPNIYGSFAGVWNSLGSSGAFDGGFATTPQSDLIKASITSDNHYAKFYFDASRSSDKYGKSTTVQPESSEWIVCIAAYETISNTGNTDVANVMSAVSQVQSNPNLHGVDHIVETWIGDKQSYIKYSNGIIDMSILANTSQTGATITLPIEILEYYSILGTALFTGTAVICQITEHFSTYINVYTSNVGSTTSGIASPVAIRICGRWK